MKLNYYVFLPAVLFLHSEAEDASTCLGPDEALLLQSKGIPQVADTHPAAEHSAFLQKHGSGFAPLAADDLSAVTMEQEVDMLVGTDGGTLPQVPHLFGLDACNGNTLPQVKRPWGMNDWVPATEEDRDADAWFFRRTDTAFKGMKCTHMPSPWMGDYADFMILPHRGSEQLRYDAHASEFWPYKFAADLEDTQGVAVRLELAPTDRAAALRLKFPPNNQDERYLTVEVKDGWLKGSSHGLHGMTHHYVDGAKKMTMFIVVNSSTPVFDAPQEDQDYANDKILRARLKFLKDDHGIFDLSVGTSFISMEQAELNMRREVGERTVDAVANEGRAVWHKALSTVEVEGLDAAQHKIFYTNLWKAMLFPRTFYELDAAGREVHYSPYTGNVEGGKLVADIGMWDAYRTVFPMLALLFPDVHQDAIAGLIQASEENAWLPQWPSPGTRIEMVGTMGDAVLADAITKCGKTCGFDRFKAYRVIRKDAFVEPAKSDTRGGRSSLAAYIKNGYVPAEDIDESVSLSLGYMLADAAVANAAESLGIFKDSSELRRRSGRYAVLFNPSSHFFQPKAQSGQFLGDFDPLAWKRGFTEGGPWHYRFQVPHDVPGLQRLMGGKLCRYVEEMLTATSGRSFHMGDYAKWGPPIHEMLEAAHIHKRFGLYAHSNQPVHDILWVAKKAGCHALADKYLRRVMAELYQLKGYAGDEDNGEMSAWYVLSALGLYQLEPGNPAYVLGSPAVRRATIQLGSGRTLHITAQNQSMENVFVQSIQWTPLGGGVRAITDSSILHEDLMSGGNLTFFMSPTPLQDSFGRTAS